MTLLDICTASSLSPLLHVTQFHPPYLLDSPQPRHPNYAIKYGMNSESKNAESSSASTTAAIPSVPYVIRLPPSCKPLAPTAAKKPLVWLVTGANGLIGSRIVAAALAHGDSCMAISRSIESKKAEAPFNHPNCLAAACDVRRKSDVAQTFEALLARFGRLDVVVNCAAWGMLAAAEEQSEQDVRGQFETNVFGTFNIITTTLPYMRQSQNGRYINFSSTVGLMGVPGLAPYSASKWAIEGLTESLAQELETFGCKATIIVMGNAQRWFDDTTRQWGHLKLSKPLIKEYRGSPADHSKHLLSRSRDRQPTDPNRVAEIVWQLAHCGSPPVRMLLGTHALDTMRDKLRDMLEVLENWSSVAQLESLV